MIGKFVLIRTINAGVLKHLIESDWMEGTETWTGEHTDIKLIPGVYEYVPQVVFDPLTKRIEAARD